MKAIAFLIAFVGVVAVIVGLAVALSIITGSLFKATSTSSSK